MVFWLRFLRRFVSFVQRRVFHGFVLFFRRQYLSSFGVVFGKRLALYGFPIVSVELGSSISIGDDCRFRSVSDGNAIGVNHPVVIRTLAPDAIIRIGNDFGMSGGAICALGLVSIGNRVFIGANVVISDSDFHPLNKVERAAGGVCQIHRDVVIGDDVWIGADAYICKGVTIGSGSVIGAKSVVTRDVASNVVVAGNPARCIRSLE